MSDAEPLRNHDLAEWVETVNLLSTILFPGDYARRAPAPDDDLLERATLMRKLSEAIDQLGDWARRSLSDEAIVDHLISLRPEE